LAGVEPADLVLPPGLPVVVDFLVWEGFDFGGVDAREWMVLDLDKEEAVGLLNLSSETPELSDFFRSGRGGCGELFDFASEAAVGA
jgi:hypothetical protein